jgi:hypothetical protein
MKPDTLARLAARIVATESMVTSLLADKLFASGDARAMAEQYLEQVDATFMVRSQEGLRPPQGSEDLSLEWAREAQREMILHALAAAEKGPL